MLKIDWMRLYDLLDVLEIERECFGAAAWTHGDFLHYLQERNAIGMTASEDGKFVGFMCYSLYPGKIDLGNLAVAVSHQRRGVGRALIEKLKSKVSKRRGLIHCFVGDRNLAAHLFFQSLGFRAVAVHRRYYNNDQDSYEFCFSRVSQGGCDVDVESEERRANRD